MEKKLRGLLWLFDISTEEAPETGTALKMSGQASILKDLSQLFDEKLNTQKGQGYPGE